VKAKLRKGKGIPVAALHEPNTMAPKAMSKDQKAAKERIADDKTFGMKNKNKSKQVQKYIKQITSNLTGQSNKAEQDARREKENKEQEAQKKKLMAGLFNLQTDRKGKAFDPVAKKAAKKLEEDAIAAGKKMKEEDKKKIIEGVANSIRLTDPKGVRMSDLGGHPIIKALKEQLVDVFRYLSLLLFIKANNAVFWVSDEEDNNPIIRCTEDVEAEVAPDERPIEEILEERRAALPPGGTPVTASTFQAWKEKKENERLAEVEAQRKERSTKKGGGGGLVGLSGRDLFTYDSSLFVDADDEGAVDADAYERDEDAPEDFDDGPKLGQRSAAIPEDGEGEEEDMSHMFDDPPPEDDDDDEDVGASSSHAAAAVKGEVPINKDLFLGGADDLPDDLDDLSD